MKRMLINATQPEELRVAMVDGQKLYDLDIETPSREQKKSNIYKGKITRVEPSLEAAFVQYGSERHGFLPFKEIARSYYAEGSGSNGKASIKDVIREGQEVVVQVDKEERGTKGAALTTFISLAGRYLVLMPNNPRAGGVSRRIEGEERDEIREALRQLETPEGAGLIVRTAGVGRNIEELQWDLNYLLQLWEMINKAAEERSAPFLIYQESNVIIRALRDYLRADTGEILIDDPGVFQQAQDFVRQVMPYNLNKLKLYQDTVPLFTRYQIESQIESAFERTVQLPSGGAIVIDHTEALISIDINSARATKGSDIEETALNTNLEAAEEIARQLRLRDLGGLIVIDFIDMGPNRNQRDVENRLREAVKMDRARVQLSRISRFGLLEMSRQRLRASLGEASQEVCPRCSGQGTIRSVESLALSILRLVEEEAMKDKTAKVMAQLPVDVATFLLNEKRDAVTEIEQRHRVQILLVPNKTMETPHYSVQRVRGDDDSADDSSYLLATDEAGDTSTLAQVSERPRAEAPAVSALSVSTEPAPTIAEPSEKPAPTKAAAAATSPATSATTTDGGVRGFFRWMSSLFSPDTAESERLADTAGDKDGESEQSGSDGGQRRRRAGQQSGAGNGRRSGGRSRRRGGRGASASDEESRATDARKGGPAKTDKKADPAAEKTDTEGNAKQTQAAAGEQKNAEGAQGGGRSRRGRRGGRRRRRGGQNAEGQSTEARNPEQDATAESSQDSGSDTAAKSEQAGSAKPSAKGAKSKPAGGSADDQQAQPEEAKKTAAAEEQQDPRMRSGRPRIPAADKAEASSKASRTDSESPEPEQAAPQTSADDTQASPKPRRRRSRKAAESSESVTESSAAQTPQKPVSDSAGAAVETVETASTEQQAKSAAESGETETTGGAEEISTAGADAAPRAWQPLQEATAEEAREEGLDSVEPEKPSKAGTAGVAAESGKDGDTGPAATDESEQQAPDERHREGKSG
ncbi:ribonuclease E [Methylonatrum kenyense]|uniref:ribonuclease E n=1 Tax=Methylonatrum kenyense TaxID=455253 RepID=UPI0020BFB32D|nr:ribonuclease E [Methylonatrum kenyense]MCK8516486.1 ribonuclease E [Methylonatrum kenyense]